MEDMKGTQFVMFTFVLVFIISCSPVIQAACTLPTVSNVYYHIDMCTLHVTWEPPSTESNCSCKISSYIMRTPSTLIQSQTTSAATLISSYGVYTVSVITFYGSMCRNYSEPVTQRVDTSGTSLEVVGDVFPEYEDISLKCKVNGPYKKYMVTWTQSIQDTIVKTFGESTNGTLSIKNVIFKATGTYTCSAVVLPCNGDTPTSHEASGNVLIEAKPKLIFKPDKISVAMGGNVTGKFDFYCFPRPCFSWVRKLYENESNILPMMDENIPVIINGKAVKIPGLATIFEICLANHNDSGSYELKVQNARGTVYMTFEVTIEGDNSTLLLLYAGVGAASALVLFSIILVCIVLRRQRRRQELELRDRLQYETGNKLLGVADTNTVNPSDNEAIYSNTTGANEIYSNTTDYVNPIKKKDRDRNQRGDNVPFQNYKASSSKLTKTSVLRERDYGNIGRTNCYESAFYSAAYDDDEFEDEDLYENQFAPGFDMNRRKVRNT